MSFILDALKKSETERQQQTGAEFTNVPSSPDKPQSFKWLWILGLLLLVNIAVLVGLLMRTDRTPDVPTTIEEMPAEQTPITEPSFEERITEAKQNQPVLTESAAIEEQAAIQQAAPGQTAAINRARVLTIDEVRLNGTLQITDLHLDIHVYSDDPAERFVFINMAKHREQSKLEEGPVVVEIRPDGVILEHQGTTFLLPRE
jgi:general secretion pathway protein B